MNEPMNMGFCRILSFNTCQSLDRAALVRMQVCCQLVFGCFLVLVAFSPLFLSPNLWVQTNIILSYWELDMDAGYTMNVFFSLCKLCSLIFERTVKYLSYILWKGKVHKQARKLQDAQAVKLTSWKAHRLTNSQSDKLKSFQTDKMTGWKDGRITI